jgi:hypothetical protein
MDRARLVMALDRKPAVVVIIFFATGSLLALPGD